MAAVASDGGDGGVDVGSLLVGEVLETGLDPGDETADADDLFFGGHGFSSRPLVDIGGGKDSFAVAEQVVEVGLQIGEVGDVGAEVVTARAAEPERAGVAAGLDVGGLGADPEGDDDLADGAAGVFGVEQLLGASPDAVAVPVELHGSHPVDGLAATVLADPVVGLGGIELAVVHQLAQHVDADSGVGVTLRVGVPVGVENDLGLVEGDAIGGGQLGHARHPCPVSEREAERGDGLGPVGVAPVGGQQLQLGERGVGPAGSHVLVLIGDQLGGVLADR